MLNISKKRKFPFNELKDGWTVTDKYFIYEIRKKYIGNFLNTWFIGDKIQASNLERNKVKFKNGELRDFIIKDEFITVKKVNKDTSYKLYNRKYNPISITIMCPTGAKFKQNDNGEYLYEMKAQIHSVDDSSFRIWWAYYYNNKNTFKELEIIRLKLMKWISSQSIIDGKDFLLKCLELGAAKESIDYN